MFGWLRRLLRRWRKVEIGGAKHSYPELLQQHPQSLQRLVQQSLREGDRDAAGVVIEALLEKGTLFRRAWSETVEPFLESAPTHAKQVLRHVGRHVTAAPDRLLVARSVRAIASGETVRSAYGLLVDSIDETTSEDVRADTLSDLLELGAHLVAANQHSPAQLAWQLDVPRVLSRGPARPELADRVLEAARTAREQKWDNVVTSLLKRDLPFSSPSAQRERDLLLAEACGPHDPDLAVSSLQRVLRDTPDDATANYLAGKALIQKAKKAKSESAFAPLRTKALEALERARAAGASPLLVTAAAGAAGAATVGALAAPLYDKAMQLSYSAKRKKARTASSYGDE